MMNCSGILRAIADGVGGCAREWSKDMICMSLINGHGPVAALVAFARQMKLGGSWDIKLNHS